MVVVAWRIGLALAFALELEHTYELGIIGGVGLAGTVGGGSVAVADDKADDNDGGDAGDATNDDDDDDDNDADDVWHNDNDNLAPGPIAAIAADNDNEEFDVVAVVFVEGT